MKEVIENYSIQTAIKQKNGEMHYKFLPLTEVKISDDKKFGELLADFENKNLELRKQIENLQKKNEELEEHLKRLENVFAQTIKEFVTK